MVGGRRWFINSRLLKALDWCCLSTKVTSGLCVFTLSSLVYLFYLATLVLILYHTVLFEVVTIHLLINS